MTLELAGQYPERATGLYVDLAEACEEAGDYGCAARAYEDALRSPEQDARLLGRAAWFYVTAPVPHGDPHRASNILARARQHDAFNGVAATAHAEMLLRQNKRDTAVQVLKEFLKKSRSEVAKNYLEALEAGTLTLHQTPREEVPRMMHKVPSAWRRTIPTGPLTDDEKLFAVELKAIEERNQGRHGAALGLYFKAIELASNAEDRLVFQLGVGRTLELAGRPAEALEVYRTLHREMPDSPEVLNRLAWFLLTTKSDAHRNAQEGEKLARRAVEVTQSSDPSVLDTLAEALIARGARNEAVALLERCVTLDPTREYYRTRLQKIQ
jgi:tetratricopeptide (TPR) repeat protein